MSKISLSPNASGTGTFTIQSPAGDTNRTFTLPDEDGELSVGGGGGFTYAAVTGATQDLDLDVGNFFDVGELTADTTLTFSNVGTEANWKYSFKAGAVSNAWDVSAAVLRKSAWVQATQTSSTDLFFKDDGTMAFIVGGGGDKLTQFVLNTPWDVGSLAFTRILPVIAQEPNPNGIFFKDDGTKLYVIGTTGDDVNEYDLSTAWDISTASYLQVFSVAAQDTNPYAIFFKPDGLKMYIAGLTNASVYEYNLSTAWDVSTASYSSNTVNVFSQTNGPVSLSFKADGTKMYVGGGGQSVTGVHEYNLSTAWDVSTASFNQSFDVEGAETNIAGLFFKPDGQRMYIIGPNADSIFEYHLSQPYSVTLPASVENPPLKYFAYNSRVTYDFFTADGGTTVTLIGEEIV